MNETLKITELLTDLNLTENQINLLTIYKSNRLDKYILKDVLTEFDESVISIIRKYYDFGFGLKLIGRELDLTYSKIRRLFKYLNINIRKGFDVVTEPLKKFRKEKAAIESRDKTGWRSSSIIRKELTGIRGIQGYYFNESLNKNVWLRSTYEYAFAIWLDYHKLKWDVEVKQYHLKDDTSYRPDFFIFDDNDNIVKIIEIKGYYDNRAYKIDFLKQQFKESYNDIEVCIFCLSNKTLTQYMINHKNYNALLRDWKTNRKLKIQE